MLIELFYQSIAIPDLNEEDLQNILAEANAFNQDHNITGCLLFYKDEFIQLLEGPAEIVDTLFEKISSDPRHVAVQLTRRATISQRSFASWSMAFHWVEAASFAQAKMIGTSSSQSSQLSLGSQLQSLLHRL